MPSRINLGPEGGPYVGIDEDNGDYILEDNAGNPIMRWDESAGQWDFEEQSLSNIQSVSAEVLRTNPTGVLLERNNSNQTIADNTVTEIEWNEATYRGGVSDIYDAENNAITVPPGYNWMRATVNLRLADSRDIDVYRIRVNGSSPEGGAMTSGNVLFAGVEAANGSSGWFSVSEGDPVSFELRVQGGATDVEFGGSNTFMEAWLI